MKPESTCNSNSSTGGTPMHPESPTSNEPVELPGVSSGGQPANVHIENQLDMFHSVIPPVRSSEISVEASGIISMPRPISALAVHDEETHWEPNVFNLSPHPQDAVFGMEAMPLGHLPLPGTSQSHPQQGQFLAHERAQLQAQAQYQRYLQQLAFQQQQLAMLQQLAMARADLIREHQDRLEQEAAATAIINPVAQRRASDSSLAQSTLLVHETDTRPSVQRPFPFAMNFPAADVNLVETESSSEQLFLSPLSNLKVGDSASPEPSAKKSPPVATSADQATACETQRNSDSGREVDATEATRSQRSLLASSGAGCYLGVSQIMPKGSELWAAQEFGKSIVRKVMRRYVDVDIEWPLSLVLAVTNVRQKRQATERVDRRFQQLGRFLFARNKHSHQVVLARFTSPENLVQFLRTVSIEVPQMLLTILKKKPSSTPSSDSEETDKQSSCDSSSEKEPKRKPRKPVPLKLEEGIVVIDDHSIPVEGLEVPTMKQRKRRSSNRRRRSKFKTSVDVANSSSSLVSTTTMTVGENPAAQRSQGITTATTQQRLQAACEALKSASCRTVRAQGAEGSLIGEDIATSSDASSSQQFLHSLNTSVTGSDQNFLQSLCSSSAPINPKQATTIGNPQEKSDDNAEENGEPATKRRKLSINRSTATLAKALSLLVQAPASSSATPG